MQRLAKKKLQKYPRKIFPKKYQKNISSILTKNKVQGIAKNKLSNKQVCQKVIVVVVVVVVMFLLVCKNLPGKANLKNLQIWQKISLQNWQQNKFKKLTKKISLHELPKKKLPGKANLKF